MDERAPRPGDRVVLGGAREIEVIPYGERVGLYGPGMAHAIILNPVGATIWRQLATPRTGNDLVAHLEERFPNVPREQLDRDVRNFLDQLHERGIILPAKE
jgi:hypothetical protein